MTSLSRQGPLGSMNFPPNFDLTERTLNRHQELNMQKAEMTGRTFEVTQDEYDTVVDVLGSPKLLGFDLVVARLGAVAEKV